MANLKHYFIDEVNVFIDEGLPEIVTITGSGAYDINHVKRYAENMVRVSYPESKLTSVIRNHKNVTLKEYQDVIGRNPPWLGNIEK